MTPDALRLADLDSRSVADSVLLELKVDDPETVAALLQCDEGAERDAFALKALRIGVLALGQARGQVDAQAVRHECQRMLDLLQHHLKEHSEGVQLRMAGSLREYFDPKGGKFQERVERLVGGGGELEQVLRKHIGQEDSQLAKSLNGFVGEGSPLRKVLSPTESNGLVAVFRDTFDRQLKAQHEAVFKEFSLNNKEGALARLVQELTDNQGKLTQSLQGKIDAVVKEFSLDAEDTALSRLVKKVTAAQEIISSEFSRDNEHSALSHLSKMLQSAESAIHGNLTLDDESSSLARLKRELVTILEAQTKTNRQFQEEVKVAIATIVAKKQMMDQTTRHGLAFEQALHAFLEEQCRQAGDLVQFTGYSTGLIKNCKTGDCVIQLGPEHVAAGGTICVEAKEERGYDLRKARDEIDEGRRNRGASTGLFVFSRKTAPERFEPLARYGNDVFVVWDSEDSANDLFLRAGLTLARALCTRQHGDRSKEQVDFTAIDKALLAIKKRYDDFDLINKHVETIVKGGEEIRNRARIMRDDLERQVDRLERQVLELKELTHAAGEEIEK